MYISALTCSWLLVRKCKVPYKFSVCYASLRGRRSKYDKFLGKLGTDTETRERMDPDLAEDEVFFDEVGKMDDVKDALREQQKRQHTIKLKMIERKYFKPPVEMNLLTFDAKEQIRYLIQEYPDEWTIDRIADSFPISRDGAVRLLMSKYQPESLKDIIRHDKSVQKNWLKVTSGEEKGGPIALRYEKLFLGGQLSKLQYAAGNKSLPMPDRKLIEATTTKIDEAKPPGIFESIVKDYVVNKQKQQEDSKSLLLTNQQENIKHLSTATGISKRQLLGGEDKSISKKLSYRKMFKYNDKILAKSENPQPSRYYNKTKSEFMDNEGMSSINKQKGNDAHRTESWESTVYSNYKDKSKVVSTAPLNQSDKLLTSKDIPAEKENMAAVIDSVSPRKTFMSTGDYGERVDKLNVELNMGHVHKSNLSTSNHLLVNKETTSSIHGHKVANNVSESKPLTSDWTSHISVNELNASAETSSTRRRPLARRRGTWRSKLRSIENITEADSSPQVTDKLSSRQNTIESLQKENVQTAAPYRGSIYREDDRPELKEIKFDYPIRLGKQFTEKEAYIYDPEKGYQHPYGKYDPKFENLNIGGDQTVLSESESKLSGNKKVESESKLYKKGNDYYDDDGEFLFRVP